MTSLDYKVAASEENICSPQDLSQVPLTVPTPITRIISQQVPEGQMQSLILEEKAYTQKKKKSKILSIYNDRNLTHV